MEKLMSGRSSQAAGRSRGIGECHVRVQMFQRARGIRLGPGKEVEVYVLIVRQTAEYCGLRSCYLCQDSCELIGVLFGEGTRGCRHEIVRLALDLELCDV